MNTSRLRLIKKFDFLDLSNYGIVSNESEVLSFLNTHPLLEIDEVSLLKKAQEAGYRTYLYFIATKDPIINISRVQNRVKKGGHPVPEEKIVSRYYYRSLKLLNEAVKYSNRAYIFDNSSQARLWIAQIDNAKEFVFKNEVVHVWVEEYLLNAK